MVIMNSFMKKVEDINKFIRFSGRTAMDIKVGKELRVVNMITTATWSELELILRGIKEVDYIEQRFIDQKDVIYVRLSNGKTLLIQTCSCLTRHYSACVLNIDRMYCNRDLKCFYNTWSKIDITTIDVSAFDILRGVFYSVIYKLELGKDIERLLMEFNKFNITIEAHAIRQLLDKILTSGYAIEFLRKLSNYNALEVLFPGLERSVDFRLNSSRHKRILFDHLLSTMRNVNQKSLELRYAALLHDIAKPYVQIPLKDRVIYPEHPEESATMASDILNRLGYNSHFIRKVSNLIYFHSSRWDHETGELNLPAMVYTLQSCTGDNTLIDQLIELQIADVITTKPPFKLDVVFNLKHDIQKFLELKGDNKK